MDVEGGSSGDIGDSQQMSFTAGPVPTDSPLVPGGFSDASVTATVPDAPAGLEIYAVQAATR